VDLDPHLIVMQRTFAAARAPVRDAAPSAAAPGTAAPAGWRAPAPSPPVGYVDFEDQAARRFVAYDDLAQRRASAPPNRAWVDARLTAALAAPPAGRALTGDVDSPTLWPNSAIGRLTIRFRTSLRTCTAWVAAERIVITAAHCVFDKTREAKTGQARGYAEAVHFEPSAGGSVRVHSAFVLKGWVAPQRSSEAPSRYDFAALVLDRPVAARTGVLGFSTAPRASRGPYASFGFPRLPTREFPGFDGDTLVRSVGMLKTDYNGLREAWNDMTEGSSGGPWIAAEDGDLVVVGINSEKPARRDDTTFSPKLGQPFLIVFAAALSAVTGV
jgi:protease YdgD